MTGGRSRLEHAAWAWRRAEWWRSRASEDARDGDWRSAGHAYGMALDLVTAGDMAMRCALETAYWAGRREQYAAQGGRHR